MQIIQSSSSLIEIGPIECSGFCNLLNEYSDSKKIILVDENTQLHCLDFLIAQFDALSNAEVIVIPSGEENKTIEICCQVWETFSEYAISRNDLLINLGGGVIGDMGGFIASIYKRGLPFVHIPTTLLAMVDASIGGKTGVDMNHLKNQLGVFAFPKAVYVDSRFLTTLSKKEILNGKVEMLKHGIALDKAHFETLCSPSSPINDETIAASITIKQSVVEEDPKENGKRKLLNLGHTVGHALESFFLNRSPISHGTAVAYGIVVEANIAHAKKLLSNDDWLKIQHVLMENCSLPSLTFTADEISFLFKIMQNDKKNRANKILCVLPLAIGKASWDNEITFSDFQSAIMSLTK
jgi:3-dehydroquinate synthase